MWKKYFFSSKVYCIYVHLRGVFAKLFKMLNEYLSIVFVKQAYFPKVPPLEKRLSTRGSHLQWGNLEVQCLESTDMKSTLLSFFCTYTELRFTCL